MELQQDGKKQAKKLDTPVPPPISLPADQYAHPGAQSEWWWHIGTLNGANGNTYGFEINAAMINGGVFTQIEITDVAKQANYQNVNMIGLTPPNWAESNPSKPWYVQLSGPGGKPSSINMTSIDGNPLNMHVVASFTDASGQSYTLDLMMYQQGPPLLVNGNGETLVYPDKPNPLQAYNFYYSLTHLQCSGTIKIGTEVVAVSGMTWMDHQYGAWAQAGSQVYWILQDIQFPNGLHMTNSSVNIKPQENVPMPSKATFLYQGRNFVVDTITTPMDPMPPSAKGVVYFKKCVVRIKDSHIKFVVTTLCPNQLFIDPVGPDIYEGVAKGEMYMEVQPFHDILIASGTAWLEQDIVG